MDVDLEMDLDQTVTMTKRQLLELLAYNNAFTGMMIEAGYKHPGGRNVVNRMRERRPLVEAYGADEGMLAEVNRFIAAGNRVPDHGLGLD